MRWITKDPLAKIDIKYKLPLGFIALYLIVFGVGGYFVIDSVYAPLNQEILQRLQSETFAQATIFDKKLETLARRAEDFSSDGFIRTQTGLLVSPLKRQDPARWLQVRERLKTHLRVNKLPLVPEFSDLQIYDLHKKRLVSLSNAALDFFSALEPDTPQDAPAFTSIILPDSSSRIPVTAILTPLWNIDRTRKIGYLACQVDLVKMIAQASASHPGRRQKPEAEKYLAFVDKRGTSIEVPWWYLEQTVSPEEEGTGIKVLSANEAIVPTAHIGRHFCKNAKEMFGQAYPLASVGWSTLIELDAAQALWPLQRLEGKLVGISLAVAITALLLLFFPVQYLVRPLGELQRMAFKIKEGDFTVRNQISSEDEIGHLARTFNLMAKAIEERTSSLEKTARDLEKQQREIRLQHNRLQTVVHSMTEGLVLLNDRGQVVLSNTAAEPIVSLLDDQLSSLNIRKCGVHESVSRGCIQCLLNPKRTTACELNVGDKIFEVITTNMPAMNGSSGKLLVARDITEREKMNQRQAHQERLAVLGKTAAVMAHELNSPLAAISMYNQMMETEIPEDSPFREHVEVIRRNTQTCQKIIRELLDYARTPKPRVERVELGDLLNNVLHFVQPLNKDKRVRVDTVFPTANVTLWGDTTQLQQVLVNLLDNAMQAVPSEGGRVELRGRLDEDRGALIIDVIDNGPGVPPERNDDIFEPFFTTKNVGGTGLGLPTARRIVKAHGGDLVLLRSRPGETVFRVTLPLKENAELVAHDATEAQSAKS
ncbi:MAG: HAMP domain-containing protein [Calditrichaeota bacterium]|nr:MAG: HAMP domain-containing protein [Calditrichota bacterium]